MSASVISVACADRVTICQRLWGWSNCWLCRYCSRKQCWGFYCFKWIIP